MRPISCRELVQDSFQVWTPRIINTHRSISSFVFGLQISKEPEYIYFVVSGCSESVKKMSELKEVRSLPEVVIYTDGGCEPNPGAGGYGVVLVHPKKRTEVSGGFRKTTNNRMEIFAAIAGLELLKQPCRVTIYSDSKYVVDAMMSGWVVSWKRKGWWRTKTERPENVDLWQRLEALCQTHQVEFRWLKGH